MIVGTCQWCEATFEARRRSRQFCGSTCRQAAHRAHDLGVALASHEDPGSAGPVLAEGGAAPPPVRLRAVTGPVTPAEATLMLSEAARRLSAEIDAASDPRELAVLAARLPGVLRALRMPAAKPAAGPERPTRLQQMREARAALDSKAGYPTTGG